MPTRPRIAPRHPAPIPRAALIAAYRAHQADTHRGRTSLTCTACASYTLAIVTHPGRH